MCILFLFAWGHVLWNSDTSGALDGEKARQCLFSIDVLWLGEAHEDVRLGFARFQCILYDTDEALETGNVEPC